MLVEVILIVAAAREQPSRDGAVVGRQFDKVTDIRRCGFSFVMGISNFLTRMFEATSRHGASIHTAGVCALAAQLGLRGESWANR